MRGVCWRTVPPERRRAAGSFASGVALTIAVLAVAMPGVALASGSCTSTSWNDGSARIGVRIACEGATPGSTSAGQVEGLNGIRKEVHAFSTPLITSNRRILWVSDPHGESGIVGGVLNCGGGRHSAFSWGCNPNKSGGAWHGDEVEHDETGPRTFGFLVAVKRPVCTRSHRTVLHIAVPLQVIEGVEEGGTAIGAATEHLTVTPPCKR